ncbi:glycoside hydrolase family 18 protein [Streptomyces sp. NPDC001795]|uniref:glycoside hydrolase family 18 protein n=1 Tax=unclassified Streptomyces TaxID=2593676 RepID=UPI003321F69B
MDTERTGQALTDESGGEAGPRCGPAGRPRGNGRPRRTWLSWTRRIALGLLLALLVPTLAVAGTLRLNYAGDPAPGTYTRNRDALWLGHAWVDGRKRDTDLDALERRLRGTGIRDLYVHAGPLEDDGTLPESAYKNARWLINAVHHELPGVRVQAWLGDELASEGPVGLRLERQATRAAVVRSARQVLAGGFDGAHVDLEPLHSGDRDYLALLDALHRVTRAHHVPLSVAAPQIDPVPALHSLAGGLTGHPKWWSQQYFGQVARRVDQIAVMSYDTAMPLQSLYGGYVAQQTSLALEVTPPSTDLLIGLPFYHEDDIGHHASAETVTVAVRGARLGLSRTDADRTHCGVALYVDFAATAADWAAYRERWVHRLNG